MKLQPLLIAVALVTGAAFAQAPNGTAKAPADTPAASASTSAEQAPAKVHKKKVAHRKHVSHHASAKRHHKEHLAMSSHNTRAMGAGASSPTTDLNASARERRMDSAYSDWQARRR